MDLLIPIECTCGQVIHVRIPARDLPVIAPTDSPATECLRCTMVWRVRLQREPAAPHDQ